MNDLGQIVGESESENVSLVNGNSELHAFLWQGGCMIDLGALVGDLGLQGNRSIATSINERGHACIVHNFMHNARMAPFTNTPEID